MPLYRRKDVWWIDLRHRGRRIRRSTRTADRDAARRQHDELAARLWRERQVGRQLSDALLAWIDERPRSDKALGTVRQIRAAYADRPLVDVTPESVERELGRRGPGAYNRLMVVIRASLNIARRRGWLESVPPFRRRPEPAAEDRHLTREEWLALRAELPAHLRDMADFALATGLRWSNVALLQWDQVALDRRAAWVPAGSAKARRAIGVPLSDAAMAVLRRVEGVDPVFVFTYAGRPIASPKTAWNKAVARAGLKGVRWHTLRHTWATWHAQSGTPLPVLKELGGWASIDIVMRRYAHLAPSYVAGFAGNVDTFLDTRPPKGRPSPR